MGKVVTNVITMRSLITIGCVMRIDKALEILKKLSDYLGSSAIFYYFSRGWRRCGCGWWWWWWWSLQRTEIKTQKSKPFSCGLKYLPPDDNFTVRILDIISRHFSIGLCHQQAATQHQNSLSAVVEEVLVWMCFMPVDRERVNGDVGEVVETGEFGVR